MEKGGRKKSHLESEENRSGRFPVYFLAVQFFFFFQIKKKKDFHFEKCILFQQYYTYLHKAGTLLV